MQKHTRHELRELQEFAAAGNSFHRLPFVSISHHFHFVNSVPPYQLTKYAAFLNPEPVLILAGAHNTKGMMEATPKTNEKEFLDNMIEEVAEVSQKDIDKTAQGY